MAKETPSSFKLLMASSQLMKPLSNPISQKANHTPKKEIATKSPLTTHSL